ncbi:MAG: amidohydrolase family protein [Acidimicrobiales bacterium]
MSDQILITGGTLIDGTGAEPAPATDVLVEPDRSVAVGQEAASSAESGAIAVDAAGKTVLPGLIDAHVHCTFDDVASNDELFFHREPTIAALSTARNLEKILRAGVTSIMDPDTVFGMGPAIRDAVDAGLIEGPRVSTGVQALLTSVGGTAGRLIPDEGTVGYAQIVNTVEEMVIWTRRHIKQGADWIKIHATGSIPTKPGELAVWSEHEMKAVCDAAHELGVPVTAHCRNAESVTWAARAGVDLILHASFMDDEGLEAVLANGSAICPTFTFLANLADFGSTVEASPGMEDIFRGEIAATGKMMRKAYDAGVPILCGSESGFALTPYGHWHGREMEVLIDALDLTPLQAITCATRNNAMAMRAEDRLGTVEPGRLADVIVVDGDPLTDIRILNDRRSMHAVISRGSLVDLDRPWPEWQPVKGWKVSAWAARSLTHETAYGSELP